jgi:hypothetical protein
VGYKQDGIIPGNFQSPDNPNDPGMAMPMGPVTISWDVIRNGVATSYRDSIYLHAGETRKYLINY